MYRDYEDGKRYIMERYVICILNADFRVIKLHILTVFTSHTWIRVLYLKKPTLHE